MTIDLRTGDRAERVYWRLEDSPPLGGDPVDRIREELDVLTKTRWWPLLPAVLDSNPQNIVLVDGNQMFNRPGPRLVDAFRFLVGWLNNRQELIPKNFPFEVL